MFKPIKENCAIHYPKMAASLTITKWEALTDNGSGLLTNASPEWMTEVFYVAAETKTTGSGETPTIACYDAFETEYISDTDENPAQTDVFTKADLAAAWTVNPDASINDTFLITWIVGAVADKKVKWRFVQKIA